MKLIKDITFIMVLVCFFGCDILDGKFTIVNQSDDTLFFEIFFGKNDSSYFPLFIKDGKENINELDFILPSEEYHNMSMDTWENQVNSTEDSSIIIYFFSKKIFETNSLDSLIKNRIYSKKMILRVTDLEKANWKIYYP